MTYSLNEVEAMAKRAARGAGYHWGHAEEAGKAVRWLAKHGLPGSAVLAKHFERHRDGNTKPQTRLPADPTINDNVCPLIAGAYLCDRASQIGNGETSELQAVAYPLLLIPYAAALSRLTGQVVDLQLDQTIAHVSADGIAIEGETGGLMVARADRAICRIAGKIVVRQEAVMGGQDLDAETLAILGALGARTYAPATEASRLAGAGAGLNDND